LHQWESYSLHGELAPGKVIVYTESLHQWESYSLHGELAPMGGKVLVLQRELALM
jgi:hypothetical protein